MKADLEVMMVLNRNPERRIDDLGKYSRKGNLIVSGIPQERGDRDGRAVESRSTA